TTMSVTWGSVSSYSGYTMQASTSSNFSGPIASSNTTIGTLTGLTFNSGDLVSNTTYYVRVGSLWNGTTAYSPTVPQSSSTLTNYLISPQVFNVMSTSVTANWVAFSSGPGTSTSEGYRLEASSTNFNGTGTIFSSATFDAAQSTLTVEGLT